MAYLYDLTDTWNAAGTVFNAIKMNVTNTASAAGSKIVSLQVGSTDRFTVDKDGNGYFSGTLQAVGSISSPNAYISGNSGTLGMQDNTASILAYNSTGSGGITNTLRFITGATERVRIDGSGNVGIGTSSPSKALSVSSGGAATPIQGGMAGIGIWNTDTTSAGISGITGSLTDPGGTSRHAGAIAFGKDGTWTAGSAYPGNITFWTRPNSTADQAERMRIDSSGNLMVGTTSAVQLLTLGSGSATSAGINQRTTTTDFAIVPSNSAGGGVNIAYNWVSGGQGPLRFSTSSGEVMRLDASGNLLVGTTSTSDKLSVAGSALFSGTVQCPVVVTGNGISTGDCQIELGGNRSGSGNSYIDWHATAGTDFEARIVRYGGANGGMDIINTGTGGIVITNEGASPMVFKTSSTEAVRITSGGNVGIGTSSPGEKLTVAGNGQFSQGTYCFVGPTSGSVQAQFAANAGGSVEVRAVSNHPMAFFTNNTERMRIDTSGNLLVGATANGGVGLSVAVDTYGRSVISNTSYASGFAANQFRYDGTTVGTIQINTTSTAYNTSSDARLKHDIVDAPEASSLIDAIRVRSFKWNADNSEQRYGMIAQELLEVAPEAVSVPADEDQMMGVDYSKLVPMLVKEIQSLRARVAQLEGN